MSIKVLNLSDKDYYDGKLFKVSLWSGFGYACYEYIVYADHVQTALELAVKYAEINDDPVLFSRNLLEETAEDLNEDTEEYIDENYIYIDATMEGAEQPWYILRENCDIKEIKEEN